ncbi:MAG: Alpha-D-kanosaminyltransferase [Syntrophorhabdaceae bacterium PtaU1.Bin034]|nr:MAG: Alpha-D-kanosaminyltransferase [Syntrophorhabdaceae bacterium PtaU1.Bin034]
MSLAYLSNYFPSLTETFIYREVIELKRRGIEVATYSLRRPDPSGISKESLPLHSGTYYLLPVTPSRLLGSHLGFFLRHPLKYFRAYLSMIYGTHVRGKDRFRSLMHFGEGVVLAEKMREDGVTHIHAHYASQAASVARVVHLLTGIPYSFTGHAHDIWHDRLLIPEKLSEAMFVTTCSDVGRCSLLGQARQDVAGKVHVVYHGLDLNSFPFSKNGEGRERNLVLSVGRLTPQKGFPDLIRACVVLKERGLGFRCVIIGEGEERQEIERLIKSAGVEKEVKLKGAVTQEQIKDYYRKAWVFALPCVDTTDGNRDGIPNVLMEAMAMGVPVVTTSNSGQSELIRDGVHGLLVPTHSPAEIADSIMRLCEDTHLRDKIVTEARKRMEQDFDNRKTIEPLLGLFERFVFDRKCGFLMAKNG